MTLYTHAGALPRHQYVFVEPNAIGKHDWLPGVWFGLTSYPGRMCGCHVLLECGAVYRNVPLHQLASRKDAEATWGPSQAQTWDCFDAKTEVLTEDGWRLFRDLAGGELLATMNLETHELEYQKPVALIAKEYAGEMIQIGGGPRQHADLLITPSHRMVVYRRRSNAPEIVAASDLKRQLRLRMKVEWKGDDAKSVTIPACGNSPAVSVDAELLAEWFGWYVAEGWCRERTLKPPPRAARTHYIGVTTGISQQDGPKADQLARLLDRLPWKYSRYSSSKNFEFYQKQVFELVKDLGNCATKRVPRWIRQASPRVITAFLRGAIAGDGWHDGASARYASVSRELAGDIQELFLKIGSNAVIRHRRASPYCIQGRSGDNTRDQYWVVQRRSSLSLVSRGAPLFKKVQYSGMVYCATVPNSTLIVRRNGKVVVCGNCYGWQFSTLEYPYLAGLSARVRFRDRIEREGEYLFTVVPVADAFSAAPEQAKEFYFVRLDNGRFTAQPTNHVLLEERSFTEDLADLTWPDFLQRQTRVWTCEEEA